MAYKHNTFRSALAYEGTLLSRYRRQIALQNKLLQRIKYCLPERLADHALYCVISEQRVSLYTDSAIWSSQLRFYQQTMLESVLSSNVGYFQTFRIKVIPEQITPSIDERLKKMPSSENIDFILSTAEQQSSDELKNALLRLGKTFQNKK